MLLAAARAMKLIPISRRISSLVEKLCTMYGSRICDIGGDTYYAFPDYVAMAEPEVTSASK